MEQAVTSPLKPFRWLSLLPVASLVLSVGLSYGATKYMQGDTQRSIETLRKQQEQMVTREELKIFMDGTRDDLKEIKENVRDIRKEVHEQR